MNQFEVQREKTDDILRDWHTPPGSPWERNEDTTFYDSSLSWDTDDIATRDDVAVPDAWDEGEETTDEVYNTASEGSNTGGKEADSLPELVSGSEDSGYDFLNTPTNEEEKDFKATAAEEC